MENIIHYLQQQISVCQLQEQQVSHECESKKITFKEISRTIDKLLLQENDTESVFRANFSDSQFRNSEVEQLNMQLKNIQTEIQNLESRVRKLREEIELLNHLLDDAENVSMKLTDLEPIQERTSSDEMIPALRAIAAKMELAFKFETMDPHRSLMELHVAYASLLSYIEK